MASTKLVVLVGGLLERCLGQPLLSLLLVLDAGQDRRRRRAPRRARCRPGAWKTRRSSPMSCSTTFGGGMILYEYMAKGRRWPAGLAFVMRARISSTALGSKGSGMFSPLFSSTALSRPPEGAIHSSLPPSFRAFCMARRVLAVGGHLLRLDLRVVAHVLLRVHAEQVTPHRERLAQRVRDDPVSGHVDDVRGEVREGRLEQQRKHGPGRPPSGGWPAARRSPRS